MGELDWHYQQELRNAGNPTGLCERDREFARKTAEVWKADLPWPLSVAISVGQTLGEIDYPLAQCSSREAADRWRRHNAEAWVKNTTHFVREC